MDQTGRPRLPDSVFKLELLQGLDAKLQELVRREARFEVEAAGATLTFQGQYSGTFWFVLQGEVTSFREDEQGKVTPLQSLAPGDWFGEINVLSHRPSMATLKTRVPSTFLVIDPPLFKELYRNRAGAFRKLIDKRYRERALAVHMKVAPLFRDLTAAQLHLIRDRVEFRDFEKDQVIAERDKPCD